MTVLSAELKRINGPSAAQRMSILYNSTHHRNHTKRLGKSLAQIEEDVLGVNFYFSQFLHGRLQQIQMHVCVRPNCVRCSCAIGDIGGGELCRESKIEIGRAHV